jgi:hypothetical protein
MDGGVFGSAWLKLQLRQAALAVELLMSCGPSLLSLSLFCYVFPIHTPQKHLFGNSRLHFSDTSIVFETTGKEIEKKPEVSSHTGDKPSGWIHQSFAIQVVGATSWVGGILSKLAAAANPFAACSPLRAYAFQF